MPTDLDPTFARKRAGQTQAQFQTTLALLIICLLMFGLLLEKFGQ
jgi:hypothetical protein